MTAKLRKKAKICGRSWEISWLICASLTAGSPIVTTRSVMAMAKTPSLSPAKRLNSTSRLPRLYRRGPRRRDRRIATAPSSRLAVGLGRGLVPARVADRPGLEEQATLGAGERHLLVGVDAAALDDLARWERAGR